MKKEVLALLVMLFLAANGNTDQENIQPTIIDISKPLPRGCGCVLGTMKYPPMKREMKFLNKVTEKIPELIFLGEDYSLENHDGQYVGWFGIVRELVWNESTKETDLILEHKYFDGMTDLHLQVVSIYGAGDFKAMISGGGKEIPLLSLVKVYGKVSKSKDGIPMVNVDYIRIWDWGRFTFMDYGKDKTNPKWIISRKVTGENVYSPSPTKQFYESRLGKKESFNKAPEAIVPQSGAQPER